MIDRLAAISNLALMIEKGRLLDYFINEGQRSLIVEGLGMLKAKQEEVANPSVKYVLRKHDVEMLRDAIDNWKLISDDQNEVFASTDHCWRTFDYVDGLIYELEKEIK
jgi:hypothetical protein